MPTTDPSCNAETTNARRKEDAANGQSTVHEATQPSSMQNQGEQLTACRPASLSAKGLTDTGDITLQVPPMNDPSDVSKSSMMSDLNKAVTRRRSLSLGMKSSISQSSAFRPAIDGVSFCIVPASELSIKVYEVQGTEMLSYEVVGDKAAISLINRISIPGADASSIRGTLAPMAPVTMSDEEKEKARVPAAAHYFAFAYPIECLAADVGKLLSLVIGSVSRLDDELLFFFLLGGFLYFDEEYTLLQANAISLKKSEAAGELHFDGPYIAEPDTAAALITAGRLTPLNLKQLNDAGLVRFGWVNPSERFDGLPIHHLVDWRSGAFVYERSDGSVVFYPTKSADSASSSFARTAALQTHAARSAEELEAGTACSTNSNTSSRSIDIDSRSHLAKGWAKEHAGFERMQESFKEELEKSEGLREAMIRRRRGPVKTWFLTYGIVVTLYYALGVLFFHTLEGFGLFDCVYFMTTTATTVGYGDLAPVTSAGRLISIFFIPIGIYVTLTGLLEPVGFLLDRLNRLNALFMAKAQHHATRLIAASSKKREIGSLSKGGRRDPLNTGAAAASALAATLGGAGGMVGRHLPGVWKPQKKGSPSDKLLWPWQTRWQPPKQSFTLEQLGGGVFVVGPFGAYLHALLQPAFIALVGCAVTMIVRSKHFLDALYLGVVTMTTVGYGDADLLPLTTAEKAYTVAFMLFSTTALALCVERLQVLFTSRRVFLQDFNVELPLLMRREAVKKHRSSPTLVEDEFVLYVLEKFGVVDADLLQAIRDDFTKIESFGITQATEDGVVELTTLYEHLVARGQVLDSNRVAPGTTREERRALLTIKRKLAERRAPIQVLREAVRGNHHGGRGGRRDKWMGPPLPGSIVDMAVPDKGYGEWFEEVWEPYLKRDHEYNESVKKHEMMQEMAQKMKAAWRGQQHRKLVKMSTFTVSQGGWKARKDTRKPRKIMRIPNAWAITSAAKGATSSFRKAKRSLPTRSPGRDLKASHPHHPPAQV